jgi:hypothetical protein
MQITMAADEEAIDRLIVERFGEVQVLSRAPLDAKALAVLRLKPGEWLEWVPLAKYGRVA